MTESSGVKMSVRLGAARAVRRVIATMIATFAIAACLGGPEASAQSRPPARATTAAAPSATSASPSPSASGVVDVNSATEAELMLLPGVGPTKARAILQTRQRMGRFRRVEDLLRVRGIGRATLRRIRTMVTLQGGTTMTSRPASPRRAASATAGSAADEEVTSAE